MFSTDFEYDGKRLSDFGLMILSFNGVNNDDTASSGADITFGQVRTAGGDNYNLYSSTYDSAYSITFQIGKNPYNISCQEDLHFSPIEASEIQAWLCQDEYCKFRIDQTGYENIYWNATFSSKQILINGRIVGLELTLFTDAPYAYMDEVKIVKEVKKDKPFVVYGLSDEIGNIKPYLKVKLKESGEKFILSNSLDSLTTEVKYVSEGEVITFYGRSQNITSSLEHEIADDFNYHYPIIGNTKNTRLNEYTSNLDCEITIKYSPIIKVGL